MVEGSIPHFTDPFPLHPYSPGGGNCCSVGLPIKDARTWTVQAHEGCVVTASGIFIYLSIKD